MINSNKPKVFNFSYEFNVICNMSIMTQNYNYLNLRAAVLDNHRPDHPARKEMDKVLVAVTTINGFNN